MFAICFPLVWTCRVVGSVRESKAKAGGVLSNSRFVRLVIRPVERRWS
jgi:hypothetical protein